MKEWWAARTVRQKVAIVVGGLVAVLIWGSLDSDEPNPSPSPTATAVLNLETPVPTRGVDPTLPATLKLQAFGFVLTNDSELEFTDCRLTINPRIFGSDWSRGIERIAPRETVELPYGTFTKSDGTRFDISTTAVKSIVVICMTPEGEKNTEFQPQER